MIEMDQDLAIRLREKDSDALLKLIEKHRTLYMGIALRRLGNPQLAEEATLELFYRAWAKGHTYTPGKAQYTTWLSRILQNICTDIIRTEARNGGLPSNTQMLESQKEELPKVVDDDEPLSRGVEARLDIQAALKQLPEEQRVPLVMHYLHDKSIVATSTRLREAVPTIKTRMHLGRKKLRSSLAGYQDN